MKNLNIYRIDKISNFTPKNKKDEDFSHNIKHVSVVRGVRSMPLRHTRRVRKQQNRNIFHTGATMRQQFPARSMHSVLFLF